MRIARRSITTGATASLAVLSFAAGVYFAVTYGSASKLEGGVAKAVETADAPTKGRSDNAPMANSVEQQTAEGALRATRDAVRIFGKTDAEMDRMITERHVDPTLVVPSPISGRITARNTAPGLLVQPGNLPAPYTVADVSTMWMLANVAESDSPAFGVGQEVKVSVMAFPNRTFEGHISTVSSSVDPTTRRLLVRSDVADPKHELRCGMFATFVIRTGEPVRSPAIPLDGVVREGNGTMTAWVTADHRRFTRRTVKIGLQRDGYVQILEGVEPGDLVATEGALFLSNALAIAAR